MNVDCQTSAATLRPASLNRSSYARSAVGAYRFLSWELEGFTSAFLDVRLRRLGVIRLK
jgi:hypothetical protein